MANFEDYQEYQRIEDFEEDSPPGEEDLLVHVPEGLKGKHVILIRKKTKQNSCTFSLRNNKKKTFCIGITVLGLWLSNVIFMLQTHGIISRTWITSSQEYPLNQIECLSLFVPKNANSP